MRQFIMEVRDVHTQEILHGGVQAGSGCFGGKGWQRFQSSPRLGIHVSLLKKWQQMLIDHPDIWTREGWLYLAVILDLFSRRVIGWSMKQRLEKQLVIDALLMAPGRRQHVVGMLHHSDRGSQYASKE